MIRASNQLVPKNKVVDHLVLYNFYFGQISSAYMKFHVLGGQNLIKMHSNSVQCLHCFCHGDGIQNRRRHASPCRRDPAPLNLSIAIAIAKFDFASPFPFPRSCGARRCTKQSSAAVGAALAALRRLAAISSRLDLPRPTSPCPARTPSRSRARSSQP